MALSFISPVASDYGEHEAARSARRCGRDQRRRLHAFQRSDLHQATRTRRFRGLASGRHHALGYADLRQGQPRLQFHGAVVRLQRRQRTLDRARLASRQGGHQGDVRCGGFGSVAGRCSAALCARRCRHVQSPGHPRLVRQHQRRRPRDRQLWFPPTQSILGARGNGIHSPGSDKIIYDADRVRERSRILGYAIDARHQRFPDEEPFRYQPHVSEGTTFEWNDAARDRIKDYNLLDLGI